MDDESDQFDPDRPTPEMLRRTYAQGAFPMADSEEGGLMWLSPDPRGIIPLADFRAPKSLERVVRSSRFSIRSNTAFADVMRACADPRADDDGTWIDDAILSAYVALHDDGDAHSIEAWYEGRLVGGLYGVHLHGAFFGESMFVRPDIGGTNASKVCLVHLMRHLREQGFSLLDTQFWNPHLEQFGCIEIPRIRYLRALGVALARPAEWGWHDASPRLTTRNPTDSSGTP